MPGAAFTSWSPFWDAGSVRLLLAWSRARGVDVARPGSREVVHADPAGGPEVRTDREGLARLAGLTDRDELSFPFWLPDGRRVPCRVRRVSGSLHATELDLDGLDDDARRQVVAMAMSMLGHDPARVAAYVVDLSGESRATDWDSVVQGGRERVRVVPTLLGVPARIAQEHPDLCELRHREDIRRCLVAIGEVDLLRAHLPDFQAALATGARRAVEELRVSAASPDGSVRVTVAGRGDLRGVEIAAGALVAAGPAAVAREVARLAADAGRRAEAAAGEIVRPLVDRRADEPVDPVFDPVLTAFERLRDLPAPLPRPDGRPVAGSIDHASWVDRLVRMRERAREASASAVSPDGVVTATVDGRGRLTGLELGAEAARAEPDELAELVVATTRTAAEDVRQLLADGGAER